MSTRDFVPKGLASSERGEGENAMPGTWPDMRIIQTKTTHLTAGRNTLTTSTKATASGHTLESLNDLLKNGEEERQARIHAATQCNLDGAPAQTWLENAAERSKRQHDDERYTRLERQNNELEVQLQKRNLAILALKPASGQLDITKKALLDQNAKIVSLQERNDKLEEEVQSLKTRNGELETKFNESRNHINTMVRKNLVLVSENEELRSDLRSAQDFDRQAKTYIDVQAEKFKSVVMAHVERQAAELEEARTELAQRKADENSRANEVQNFKTQLHLREQVVVENERQISQLLAHVTRLGNNGVQLSKKCRDTETKLSQLETEMTRDAKSREHVLTAWKARYAALQARVNQLTQANTAREQAENQPRQCTSSHRAIIVSSLNPQPTDDGSTEGDDGNFEHVEYRDTMSASPTRKEKPALSTLLEGCSDVVIIEGIGSESGSEDLHN